MFNRIVWVRAERKARAIQDEIRSIRMNLVAVIGILASSTAMRTELQVAELRFIGDEIRTINGSLAKLDPAIACHESVGKSISKTLEAPERTEPQLNSYLTAYGASRKTVILSSESIYPRRQTPFSEGSMGHWDLKMLCTRKRQRSFCKSSCACRCHQRCMLASSKKWQSIVGQLFVGYTGLPVVSPCDDIRCQPIPETLIEFRYYFPEWFMARVLEIGIQFSKPLRVAQSLRVDRVVWADSKLFLAARIGDVSALKALLSSREGTPYDVIEGNGETALTVSIT